MQRWDAPPYVTDPCPDGMGMPSTRVSQVCNAPDSTHDIQHDDLLLRLFLKSEPSWDDLVICQMQPSKQVAFAFRLPRQPGETTSSTPLGVLKAFAATCCLDISLGTFSGRLLLHEQIPITESKSSQLFSVSNPDDHPYQWSQFIRIKDGIADAALAFCVDLKRYSDLQK